MLWDFGSLGRSGHEGHNLYSALCFFGSGTSADSYHKYAFRCLDRGMHLPPSSWGPFFWHTMHICALGYPVKPTYGHKKAAKEFYEALAFLIPCPICRDHYTEFLKQMPITPFLDRRDDLFKWTVAVHNKVNETLGKPQFSELESIEFYRRLGASGRTPVMKPDDFAEADLRAMIKGMSLGVAATVTVGGVLWWINKSS